MFNVMIAKKNGVGCSNLRFNKTNTNFVIFLLALGEYAFPLSRYHAIK